jgi:hypothetical protein
MTGVIDVYLQVNKFWVVFYIIEVLRTCFLNRNAITFLNPLICIDAQEKIKSALYGHNHC